MLMTHIIDLPEPMTGESGTGAGASGESGGVTGGAVTPPAYSTNVSTLTERIAIRLAADGAEHAVAAAITIALRGESGHDTAAFAAAIGLPLADLRALEAGTIAFVDLPPAICDRMHTAGLEPLLLVDLDHQLRGR